MGLYEVPLSVSLLGFGIRTMLANFHAWGIMFLLRAVLNILVRNASPREHMCFRCLIFRLSRKVNTTRPVRLQTVAISVQIQHC